MSPDRGPWRRQKRPCATCGTLCSGRQCRACYRLTLPGKGPDRAYTWSERQRRKALVDQHIAEFGWTCPGYSRPQHAVEPGPRRLSADHVTPVGAGGDESGELQVLCVPCNSAKRDGSPRGRSGRTVTRRQPPAVRHAEPRSAPPARVPVAEPVPEVYDMPTNKPRRLESVPEPVEDEEPREIPDPPERLGAAGRRIWDDVTAEYDLEEHELALLAQYVRVVDTCEKLQELVDAEGLMVPILPAGEKTHPALVELRQQRIALARLGATLRLPSGDQDGEDAVKRPQRRGGARGVYGIRGAV